MRKFFAALVLVGFMAASIAWLGSDSAPSQAQGGSATHTAPTPLAFPAGLALLGGIIAMRPRRRETSI
jgi:hypothetical protein